MPFDCCVCGRSIGSELGLQAHVSTRHLNWQPFECFHCATFAATAAELSVHLHTAHPRLPAKHVFSADAAKQLQLARLVRRSLGRVAPPSNPPPSLLKLDIADSSTLPLDVPLMQGNVVVGSNNNSLINSPRRIDDPPSLLQNNLSGRLLPQRFAAFMPMENRVSIRQLTPILPAEVVCSQPASAEAPEMAIALADDQDHSAANDADVVPIVDQVVAVQNLLSSPSTCNNDADQREADVNCDEERKAMVCNMCQAEVSRPATRTIRSHILRRHIAEPLFKCPACSFTSNVFANDIRTHMKKVHKDNWSKPVELQECSVVHGRVRQLLPKCFPNFQLRKCGRPHKNKPQPKR